MKHELPIILGAGLFESRKRFRGLSVTRQRRVGTFELEYFSEDGGTSFINGTAYPVCAGNILFAKPDDIRYSHLHFNCMFLHFTVSDATLITALEGMRPVFPAANPAKTEALFASIISHTYSANRFDNIAACAELVTLLHRISNTDAEDTTLLSKAQKFIESHYRDELSAESIAAACGISQPYLYKLFKNSLDTTPGEYLLACRISAARDMLVNTEMPMSEIAFGCGFNSQSYFSDRFRKIVGVSPKEYRKNAAYSL